MADALKFNDGLKNVKLLRFHSYKLILLLRLGSVAYPKFIFTGDVGDDKEGLFFSKCGVKWVGMVI